MKIEHDGSITGVLVCCPCYGLNVNAYTVSGLYQVGQSLTASGIPNQLLWLSMADIVDARNMMITKFYDSYPTASHILFIDADMNFNLELIKRCFAFNKDITGVLYSRRQIPLSIIGSRSPTDAELIVDGFMKMNHIGAGVMLIKRSIVKTIIEGFPEAIERPDAEIAKRTGNDRILRIFDKCRDSAGTLLSEDYSFCERALRVGGEVWANIDQPIGHVGMFDYMVRYADSIEKAEEKAAA